MNPEQRLNVLKLLQQRARGERDTKAAAALQDAIDWATADAFTEGGIRRTAHAITRIPLRRSGRLGQLGRSSDSATARHVELEEAEEETDLEDDEDA